MTIFHRNHNKIGSDRHTPFYVSESPVGLSHDSFSVVWDPGPCVIPKLVTLGLY